MALGELEFNRWLYGLGPYQRRTQDSPIKPDVWYAYALGDAEPESDPLPPLVADGTATPSLTTVSWNAPDGEGPRVDLLIHPHQSEGVGPLAATLASRLGENAVETYLAANDVCVATELTLPQLLQAVLPLSDFWHGIWLRKSGRLGEALEGRTQDIAAHFQTEAGRLHGRQQIVDDEIPGNVVWLVGLVGRIAWEHANPGARAELPTAQQVVDAGLVLLGDLDLDRRNHTALVRSATRNRPVTTAVWRSRVACKADAAQRLFDISCRDVRWAVLDSGIDARHPAFVQRLAGEPVTGVANSPAHSRVRGTWDFTRAREVLAANGPPPTDLSTVDPAEVTRQRLELGRAIDWGPIAAELLVPHDTGYVAPIDDHGTHVAGIIGADWRADDQPSAGRNDVLGMCPDIDLYDLRAFDAEGRSDEFSILSAMQFVRYLNANANVDQPVIHGVNLSFSVVHEVTRYAVGATPICAEVERLVGNGVMVVAAAGNDGRGGYVVKGRSVEGYRTVSITDPGNAEAAITVGATHRDRPHTYGVSYFSSRGPTGDGRSKPDLVAPGEKVTAPVPELGLQTKDGTSQAAPHVSGACALLLARNPELLGQPARVKQILMQAATDLGRDRYFQGAGMLDVLRALQSV